MFVCIVKVDVVAYMIGLLNLIEIPLSVVQHDAVQKYARGQLKELARLSVFIGSGIYSTSHVFPFLRDPGNL
jgi:hypothetical protein